MAFKNVTTLFLLSITISLCSMEERNCSEFDLSSLNLSQESGKPPLELLPMDGDTTPRMSISDKFKNALKNKPKSSRQGSGVGKVQKDKNINGKSTHWSDRRKKLDQNLDPKNCISKNCLTSHRSEPVYKHNWKGIKLSHH